MLAADSTHGRGEKRTGTVWNVCLIMIVCLGGLPGLPIRPEFCCVGSGGSSHIFKDWGGLTKNETKSGLRGSAPAVNPNVPAHSTVILFDAV